MAVVVVEQLAQLAPVVYKGQVDEDIQGKGLEMEVWNKSINKWGLWKL